MISFVSKLFSGLFVISLEIRLHKKQIHLGPMNLRYQTPSPNIFCCLHFLCFLFGKSARCATSRLTTTASFCKLSGMAFASLPMCQCAFLHIRLARMGSQTQTPCYAIDLPDCNAVLTNYRITPVCHATAVKFHSLPTLHNDGSTIHILEL